MDKNASILGLYIGQPEHRWEGKEPSAIRKIRAEGTQDVNQTGFVLDQQADLTVHGGLEKAIHHYPSEHYSQWQEQFPETSAAYQIGGFGENLSTAGFTEEDLCVGDVIAAGSARLQISQGRQPCWKLNLHTGNSKMAAAFQKAGKTGWYYRVLETGHITVGDDMKIIERPCPDWILRDVILARFNPRLDQETAARLAELRELAEPWRISFAKKAHPAFHEDTSRRLKGV
ncbi:MAG: MOSC domain-containing protein [Roseibium sp.]